MEPLYQYVAPDGTDYSPASMLLDSELRNAEEISDGGEATGEIYFEIPTDQIEGGTWTVSIDWQNDLHFAAN